MPRDILEILLAQAMSDQPSPTVQIIFARHQKKSKNLNFPDFRFWSFGKTRRVNTRLWHGRWKKNRLQAFPAVKTLKTRMTFRLDLDRMYSLLTFPTHDIKSVHTRKSVAVLCTENTCMNFTQWRCCFLPAATKSVNVQ